MEQLSASECFSKKSRSSRARKRRGGWNSAQVEATGTIMKRVNCIMHHKAGTFMRCAGTLAVSNWTIIFQVQSSMGIVESLSVVPDSNTTRTR